MDTTNSKTKDFGRRKEIVERMVEMGRTQPSTLRRSKGTRSGERRGKSLIFLPRKRFLVLHKVLHFFSSVGGYGLLLNANYGIHISNFQTLRYLNRELLISCSKMYKVQGVPFNLSKTYSFVNGKCFKHPVH